MVNHGLLVRFEAQHGKETEVEAFLLSALPMVRQEPETTAWFPVRFGRSEYGIFDVFPDERGREAHLNGPVAQALRERTDTLFTEPPQIRKLGVLASKLPAAPPAEPITKGLILTFEAKDGHEAQGEASLREAQPLALEEPDTIAWFGAHPPRVGQARPLTARQRAGDASARRPGRQAPRLAQLHPIRRAGVPVRLRRS